tara:strand:- start:677 stop:883 length:207 start_codon:yes stop_codon:yes gene_type:complete
VFDEVEAYAADYGDFGLGHGTEEFLDGDFFACDFRCGVEDVVVSNRDDFGFEPSFFCCGTTDIEVRRW